MRKPDASRASSIGPVDRGATAVEYALIVALIAAVIAASVTLVGLDTLELWERADW